jgi:hypothetical protein
VNAAGAQDGGRPGEVAVLIREIANLPVIWTRLSRRLARTHDTRTLYALDAKGGGRSLKIVHKMPGTSGLGQTATNDGASLPVRLSPDSAPTSPLRRSGYSAISKPLKFQR